MFTILGGDGKEYGPVSTDQIRSWLAENRANFDTKVKPVGTADWKRLGDLPEFSAGAGTASLPPATGPGGAPLSTTPSAPENLVFTGEWTEYFKIWIVNVLLTIFTLGIYAAWAKVRRRRYFSANTSVFGHTFEYLGNPVKILYGNLIVVGVFGLYAVLSAISPLLALPFFVAFVIAMPWFITRALAFNARNTAWRGLRFNFTGTYGEAACIFLLWPLLIVLTLGLILPLILKKQKEFIVRRHTFGTTPFSFTGETADFYKIYGITVLFFLPMMFSSVGVFGIILGVASAIAGAVYFHSRIFNYVWDNTELAGNNFVASMRARDLFLLHLVNGLVTILTLGLMHPWAAVRTVKFQLDSLQIVPAGNVDTFVAAAQPPVSALGEAASDFFDFDLGFGL